MSAQSPPQQQQNGTPATEPILTAAERAEVEEDLKKVRVFPLFARMIRLLSHFADRGRDRNAAPGAAGAYSSRERAEAQAGHDTVDGAAE